MTEYKINRSIIVSASRTGRLDLHNLALESVPSSLFTSPLLVDSLTALDLSANRITSLPHALTSLHKLKELLLDDNQLHSLPVWLCELPALKSIAIEGNPLDVELLRLYQRGKTVHTGSGRGREVGPVLNWLMAHEESGSDHQAGKAAATAEAASSVSAPGSTSSSASSSPATSRPSSADSDSSTASRSKQASLSSDLFSCGPSPPSGPQAGKKLHSHQQTNVFAYASQPYDGHTGKKVPHTSIQGNAINAPFGTDSQPVEAVKPRRLGREESEKENELSATVKSSPYAYIPGKSDDSRPSSQHGTGKRMQPRDQPHSQTPFATLPNAANHFQSSSAAASTQILLAEKDRLAGSGASTPTAGSPRQQTDGNTMSAALSHLQIGNGGVGPVLNERKGGIRIVDKGTTDIFNLGGSSGGAQVEKGVGKGKPHPSAESKPEDDGFGSGAYVQRGGRARVNHGQKDTALW